VITLHTWCTPNGRKISIMLEEISRPYVVKTVDINSDEQFSPDYLKISPNNKIPAITDYLPDGAPLAVFESGAILTYLAETSGQLLAPSGQARYQTLEWLHWSIAGLGPMLGQLMFFAVRSEEKAPLAIERFTREADRLLGVLEARLAEAPFLGGDDYSIADIAAYPWVLTATTALGEVLATSLTSKPALHRWLKRVGQRPAVVRGMDIPPDV
jgi:GST-like protein